MLSKKKIAIVSNLNLASGTNSCSAELSMKNVFFDLGARSKKISVCLKSNIKTRQSPLHSGHELCPANCPMTVCDKYGR